MFNTTLRRVVRSCPNAIPINTRPSVPSLAATISTRHSQRRHSSSKPPSPPNSGSSAAPPSSVKQVGAPRTTISKRKVAKDKTDPKQDQQDEWTSKLPSVPSTQHLNERDICLAAFFSTHRPISVSGPIPPETSIEDIDKIFQPKPKTKRPGQGDVIYTISSAVKGLDESIARSQQSSQQDQSFAQKADIIKALTQHNDNAHTPAESNQTHHLDGQPQTQQVRVVNGVKLAIQEIARRFRPHNAPPVPVALSEAEYEKKQLEVRAAEQGEEQQARELELQIERQDAGPQVQHVVLNIQSKPPTDAQFFTSHETIEISEPTETQEVTEGVPARSGGRIRPRMRIPIRNHEEMLAISVKRQRRLKMKKHKFKKLMRRTRNLRRRQDKL